MMIYVEKVIYGSVDNEIVQPPLTLSPGSATADDTELKDYNRFKPT